MVFLTQTHSQGTILCSAQFPTRPEACPADFEPVCADYPNICMGPPCPGQVRDFPSPCEACQDPNVKAYVLGLCPDYEVNNEQSDWECNEGEEGCWTQEEILEWLRNHTDLSKIYCQADPDNSVECHDTYVPVCGFYEGSEIGADFQNGCFACYSGKVDYFREGECSEYQ